MIVDFPISQLSSKYMYVPLFYAAIGYMYIYHNRFWEKQFWTWASLFQYSLQLNVTRIPNTTSEAVEKLSLPWKFQISKHTLFMLLNAVFQAIWNYNDNDITHWYSYNIFPAAGLTYFQDRYYFGHILIIFLIFYILNFSLRCMVWLLWSIEYCMKHRKNMLVLLTEQARLLILVYYFPRHVDRHPAPVKILPLVFLLYCYERKHVPCALPNIFIIFSSYSWSCIVVIVILVITIVSLISH